MNDLPLHRLNTGHIKAWLFVPGVKREMASWLGKTYRTGCILLSPTLRAFAVVSPTGIITELAPPHKRHQMWEIANSPSARAGECACRGFWDPETQGPWGARPKEREQNVHSPFCQFRQVAQATFDRAYKEATFRVSEGRVPEPRPDAWNRVAEEFEGKR